MKKTLLSAITALTLALWAPKIFAQDQAQSDFTLAQTITANQHALTGSIGDGEQDVWRFEVSPDAPPVVTFASVEGLEKSGGLLLIARITRDNNGAISRRDDITRVALAPFQPAGRVELPKRYLPPGEYALGLAPFVTGGGDYILNLYQEGGASLGDRLDPGIWEVPVGKEVSCKPLSPSEAVDLAVLSDGSTDVTVELRQAETEDRLLSDTVGLLWRTSQLAADTYEVCLRAAQETKVLLDVSSSELTAREAEPNDDTLRTTLVPGDQWSGRFDPRGSGSDTEWLRLRAQATPVEIQVRAASQEAPRFKLLTPDGQELKSGSIDSEMVIGPLDADTEFDLFLTGRKPGVSQVVLRALDPLGDYQEREPNDRIPRGPVLSGDAFVDGAVDSGDPDLHLLDATDGPQLWRVQVTGDGVSQMTIADAAGTPLVDARSDGTGRIRVSHLFLMPGPHQLAIFGDGAYRLRAIPLGPRRPDIEAEPNSSANTAALISIGSRLRGMLTPGDIDRYRFAYAGNERLQINLTPPLGHGVSLELSSDGARLFRQEIQPGETLTYDRAFRPGSYELELRPLDASPVPDDYYLEVLVAPDQFPSGHDREPNDFHVTPFAWSLDEPLRGRVGEVRDSDFYKVSPSSAVTLDNCDTTKEIGWTVTQISADDARVQQERFKRDDGAQCSSVSLEAGEAYLIELTSSARGTTPTPYEITVRNAVPNETTVPAAGDLTLALAEEIQPPRAFLLDQSQTVSVTLRLEGHPSETAPPDVELVLSDAGVTVSDVDIAPQNDAWRITARLQFPPDLTERPVRLHLNANAAGKAAFLSTQIDPNRDAPPQNAVPYQALPTEMQGGFNVSAAARGARVLTLDGQEMDRSVDGVRNAAALIDGYAVAEETFYLEAATGQAQFSFDLAGDEVIPLAGVLLTPRAYPGAASTLRRFSIEASKNGSDFSEVYRGVLRPQPTEQAVVFQPPVEATALRLVAHDAWRFDQFPERRVRLGEFKAIAVPGEVPSFAKRRDLADPVNGGHVVWSDPPALSGRNWNSGLLVADLERADTIKADAARFVLGFNHARPAWIETLEWDQTAPLPNDETAAPGPVSVSGSMISPLGPWTPVARFSPTDGEIVSHQLPEPVQARYLRFDFEAQAPLGRLAMPERVGVIEAPVTSGTPSILGEWGEFSDRMGPEPNKDAALLARPEGGSKTAPIKLGTGVTQISRVERNVHEDWWLLDALKANTEVAIDVTTPANGGVRVALHAPDGTEIPLRRASEEEQRERTAEGALFLGRTLEEGQHTIRVYEPRRAIVVSWDTSGSTTPYRTAIDRALRDIAARADPENDLVNFIPFGADALADDLSGEPELLLRSLAAYGGTGNSSNAEIAIIRASELLEEHDGSRGLVLITDAATNQEEKLWETLARVRPTIAALSLPSTGALSSNPAAERDLMETWARSSGGLYAYVTDQQDFLDNFDRAIALLQRPKIYGIRVTTSDKPQLPGRLLVTERAEPDQKGDGVEAGTILVLVDTSGSMLRRLDGERRIEIAKSALNTLNTNIEASAQTLAIRLFGIVPGACDTSLLLPPDRDAGVSVDALIAGISPQNRARTPIALALAEAAKDLEGRVDPRRVIVLTDGEETCDGDPGAEIEALVAAGFTTQIDIVGFEIADTALQQEFRRWAELGNGSYFDARSATELSDALRRAAQASYVIYDAAGNIVISGRVGTAPHELPPGRYTVENQDSGAQAMVEVAPQEDLRVALP